MRRTGLFSIVVLACTVAAARADFTANTSVYPDITTFGVSLNYDADLDLFTATASGFFAYNDGVNVTPIMNGVFNITATIDDTGTATAGTFSLEGDLDLGGGTLGPNLLSGHLLDFVTHSGDGFNFLFQITSGDLKSIYGSHVVVILNGGGSSFAGLWTEDFGADQTGLADTLMMVPSPSSALLALIGGAMLGFVRRRQAA